MKYDTTILDGFNEIIDHIGGLLDSLESIKETDPVRYVTLSHQYTSVKQYAEYELGKWQDPEFLEYLNTSHLVELV